MFHQKLDWQAPLGCSLVVNHRFDRFWLLVIWKERFRINGSLKMKMSSNGRLKTLLRFNICPLLPLKQSLIHPVEQPFRTTLYESDNPSFCWDVLFYDGGWAKLSIHQDELKLLLTDIFTIELLRHCHAYLLELVVNHT